MKRWASALGVLVILIGAVIAFGLPWVGQVMRHPKSHIATCVITLVVWRLGAYACKRRPVESEPAPVVPAVAPVAPVVNEDGELPGGAYNMAPQGENAQ